jgi:hypothetical protein
MPKTDGNVRNTTRRSLTHLRQCCNGLLKILATYSRSVDRNTFPTRGAGYACNHESRRGSLGSRIKRLMCLCAHRVVARCSSIGRRNSALEGIVPSREDPLHFFCPRACRRQAYPSLRRSTSSDCSSCSHLHAHLACSGNEAGIRRSNPPLCPASL